LRLPRGDLVKILNLFGKKEVSDEITKRMPYLIITEFVPYKLHANKRSTATLMLRLKNMSSEPLLTSAVIEVPKQISLDETGITKTKEVRLGELAPNEEALSKVDIFSDTGTDAGEYTISVTAMAHYRDYGHVINGMRKRTTISAV